MILLFVVFVIVFGIFGIGNVLVIVVLFFVLLLFVMCNVYEGMKNVLVVLCEVVKGIGMMGW